MIAEDLPLTEQERHEVMQSIGPGMTEADIAQQRMADIEAYYAAREAKLAEREARIEAAMAEVEERAEDAMRSLEAMHREILEEHAARERYVPVENQDAD